MSFNPNQLLNNPAAMLNPSLAAKTMGTADNKEPVAPPPFEEAMYANAYGRLGLLSIANVVDLGCGAGNFVKIMRDRKQKPEMYLGIDCSHKCISTAKAAYPGWNFLYGDFYNERVRAEYERFDAILLLNMVDTIEDDVTLLQFMPEGKPLVFSVPKAPREGSLRHFTEGRDVYEKYSSFLNIRSIGRFKNNAGEEWSMINASKW